MKNFFPYQFLAEVTRAAQVLTVPRFLREVAKDVELIDFKRLEEFLNHELQNTSLQNQTEVDYFLFIIKQALNFQYHERNFEGFQETQEIIRHRMIALRSIQADVNMKAWEIYLLFFETAFLRLIRHISIEEFEKGLDTLDWNQMDESFIPQLSTLIGYTYLHESQADQAAKARIWLQKALFECKDEAKLIPYIYQGHYYLREKKEEHAELLGQISQQLRTQEVEDEFKPLFQSAAFDLEVAAIGFSFVYFEDVQAQLEYCQQKTEQVTKSYHVLADNGRLPRFAKPQIAVRIGQLYADLSTLTQDGEEQKNYTEHALSFIDGAINEARDLKHTSSEKKYQLNRIQTATLCKVTTPEKEIKELNQFYKKCLDYPAYIETNSTYAHALVLNGNPAKTYDQILDIFKYGNRKLEQGGIYLMVKGLSIANDIFLEEVKKSGVSWIVNKLTDFFEQIQEVVELLPSHLEDFGKSIIDTFKEEFIRFEPVSHFNIRTYYRYQFYQIKMLEISLLMNKDAIGQRMASSLLHGIKNDNNPLSYMDGAWDDFKKVPNMVRNKTLNKCIDITKGDLPAAAEHLDFSYRNLRSYITFKEVNRLGFFLDMQLTNNKQLEQGIRYMFYDLYKNGTIFEVVFDMPKFLVSHSKTGFYSQNLEEELNIKGTTAKKYIKIMIENGLIRQDKTTGRKHFYRLIRENVMTRLGKDQATLIKPEA